MKLITSILLVTFLFTNQISVQAATNDNKKISINNIEEIIVENSPQFKIIENNLKKCEESYDDCTEDLNDEEDKVNNLKNQINLPGKVLLPDELKDLQEKLSKSEEAVKDLKNKKNSARYELRTYKINYEKELQGLVESAQKQYIAYIDILLKKQLKQAEANMKNKQVEINAVKYNQGFISKKEYEKNLDDIKDFNNEEEKLEVDEKNQFKDLIFSLGIKDDAKFDINVNFDVDKISKINIQEDLDEMLLNNIDLKVKNIEIDKQEDLDETSDYDTKNNKISLKQEEEKAKLEFEKKYNNLMLSNNLIKSENDKLNRTHNDSLIMQTKYNYGFASKKQLDQLEIDLNNKNQDFITQVNNLYMDYLSYMKMKDGY